MEDILGRPERPELHRRARRGSAGDKLTREELARRWKLAEERGLIWLRRLRHVTHNIFAGHRLSAPVSFLAVSAALGLALTVTTLYTPSYAVFVDGEQVGVVADQSEVDAAVAAVEEEGTTLLGYDYSVDSDISYEFALTLRSDLTEQGDLQDVFYQDLAQVSDQLRKYEVVLNGESVGVVSDQEALEALLNELKGAYANENTVSAEFVEDVQVRGVYQSESLMNVDEMRTALTANTTGDTTYTVVKGDTFNAIAYANDMSVSDLKELNPGVDINRLMIGDELNIKEKIPLLSVRTTDHVTYTEEIECPVEEVEDSSLYVGTTKVLVEGTPGQARVTADVTYVNGKEVERNVLSSTTLQEPTVTTMAVGTKPKPKTASNGYYIWPCSGTITSYFGGRYIFGSYSYHSGLDIATSYGTSIKAADGGKVTFAGYKGAYGYLVIITHDNGTQTYYGHCSSLLVSAGDRVYQGQVVARVGSSGRSTGPHCHFEVRVGGSSVNPLNYLR